MQVLLLDMTYEPIKVIPFKKAMKMLVKGKAEIIEAQEDVGYYFSKTYILPSIIRQLMKFRPGKKVPFTKTNIFVRDEWTCQYCTKRFKSEQLTFDHVVPTAQGGKTTWENIATACQPCNWKKANRTPEQAGMRLLKKPEKLKWKPMMVIRMKPDNVPEVWKAYLDPTSFAYWNTSLQPA